MKQLLAIASLAALLAGCGNPTISSEDRIAKCVKLYSDTSDSNGMVGGKDVQAQQRDKCKRAEAEDRLTDKGGYKD